MKSKGIRGMVSIVNGTFVRKNGKLTGHNDRTYYKSRK